MANSETPNWFRKWGIFGALGALGVYLLRLGFEALIQESVVEYWKNSFIPFFSKQLYFHFKIMGWQLTVFIIIVVFFIAVLGIKLPKRFRNKRGGAPRPLPPGSYNSAEVIRAVVMARRKEITIEEMCKIIEQAVNLKKLKPEVGSQLLSEFGYILVIETDGDYRAMKRRSNESE